MLADELDLNDVSILFPLPTSGQSDALMSPSTRAAYGELLPRAVLALAPALTPDHDAAALHAELRVVSARIDPCFPSLLAAPSPSCRFQVRLVLQPIEDDGVELRADDAAVHLFYDLPVGDFVGLVGELSAARAEAGAIAKRGPLDVHPVLSVEGLAGPYAERVERALLAVIGQQRLTRMTFIALGGDHDVWTFGGFDFTDGEATPVTISSSAVTLQTFANDVASDPLAFAATVEPALEQSENIGLVYDSANAEKLDDESLWPLYESVLRIESPNHHSPASVDCVSCHTAQAARLWLERNTALARRSSPFRYRSGFDLRVTHAVDDTTSAVRAFGWQGNRPAISARVVNESAAVASWLNERLWH